MANLDTQQEFREALDEDIFNEIGKEVTLIVEGSIVYNDRGEEEDATTTSSTIIAVPYNITNDRESQQSFGDILDGDMDMVLRYDQVITINNKVVIDGDTYKVKEIQKNYLPDNVATIVRLNKIAPLEDDNTNTDLYLLDIGSNQLLDANSNTLFVTG